MTSTQVPPSTHQQLYDTDFVEWISQAAELLQQGKFSELDIKNLIEEIEDLGRSQKQALKSNLRVLLMHLLKWQYQPSQRSGSWRGSIVEHRKRIHDALKDSPSLKNYYSSVLQESYTTAREIAAYETGLPLDNFPAECFYTAERVLDRDFLPE
ncbi:MAG: DUF29 domain-containing protein [Thermosynechococcaceae cyanobacterium]